VVEAKTTEVYAIKASTLVNYVSDLISERRISSWDHALGLYVVARVDPEINQLENAIIAERRTQQLRVISVDALISLAEMMNEFDLSHENMLAVLKPSGPKVDAIVDLMSQLVAQGKAEEGSILGEVLAPIPPPRVAQSEALSPPVVTSGNEQGTDVAYWITPVKSDEEGTAEETITSLVGKEALYAFGEKTPGRKHLKPGDRICFYATTVGVVADAIVATRPAREPHPRLRHPENFPWTFNLESQRSYLDKPVIIDVAVRAQLDAFKHRDPSKSWSWFVQATSKLTEHDFEMLTQQE
jgi:hypothetical protein